MGWILHIKDTENGEDYFELWDMCSNARAFACDHIQDKIRDWNMSDELCRNVAFDINNSIAARAYREAIQIYHDYMDGNPGTYYEICSRVERTDVPSVSIFEKEFFGFEEDEEGDHDGSDAEVPEPTVYVATSPGATCRQCSNTNEYAYADRSDGTHVCHSCKIFKGIFS